LIGVSKIKIPILKIKNWKITSFQTQFLKFIKIFNLYKSCLYIGKLIS
jgi:hypothetical protein